MLNHHEDNGEESFPLNSIQLILNEKNYLEGCTGGDCTILSKKIHELIELVDGDSELKKTLLEVWQNVYFMVL